LTPHPMRGKRNEPAYTVHVLEKIAKIKSVPLEEVAEVTYKNTKNLFRINF
ncbi:TatD family hydrolase, partial [candidate division WOR-3 bacterium]|nr:TatD family hydrolase [candidate division WOR-3 bacterium]